MEKTRKIKKVTGFRDDNSFAVKDCEPNNKFVIRPERGSAKPVVTFTEERIAASSSAVWQDTAASGNG
jgi:hypothetical protein